MREEARSKEEGYVLVVVAGILIVLIGFVALGVDTGALYSARTSAQEVADAAALAGAFTFINTPQSPQPATANNNALQVALANTVMGQPIVTGDVTVSTDVNNQRVTVEVASAQSTYFARAIGISSANIRVTATAEAAKQGTVSSCARPWFIPNTLFATPPICTNDCNTAQLLIDPVTEEVTDFGQDQLDAAREFTLKPQSPHDAIAPGQFYAIDIPNDLNGDDYRNNISTCTNALIRCHNTYSVLTGNRVGPTKLGIWDLIGNPSEYHWTGTPGEYTKGNPPGSAIYDMAPNVVIAPIWNSCGLAGFCPDGNFPNGTNVTLEVVGFAVLFLKEINGDDVVAHLMNLSACGPTSGGTPDAGGTVLSFPLRLVRVP